MKIALLILALLLSGGSQAQDAAAPVVRVFTTSVRQAENFRLISDIKWSPDGKYLAAKSSSESLSLDGKPYNFWYILDTATGELIRDVGGIVMWYADSSRALVSNDTSYLWSWDIHTDETFTLRRGISTVIDYSPDGFIYDDIVILDAGTLSIYDSADGVLKFTRSDIREQPRYSGNRLRIAVQTNEGIEVYDTGTWTLADSLPDYLIDWDDRQWSADNQHLIVTPLSSRSRLQPKYIWKVGGGLSAPIYNLDSPVWWTPDGTQMAEANDAEVRFFDSTTGKRISTVRGLPVGQGLPLGGGRVIDANDTYIVTEHGSYAGSGRVFVAVTNYHTGQVVFEERVGLVHVSLWDDMLYIQDFGKNFRLYDLTGQNAPIVLDMPNPLTKLSPDGDWLLSYVWPQPEIQPIEGVLYRLNPSDRFSFDIGLLDNVDLSWGPDGRRFAIFGSTSNTLAVWEIVD